MKTALASGLLVMGLAGCAIAAPQADVPGGASPRPSSSADPEAGATIPSDPFPATDTVFDAAPAGLRRAWRPFHVSLIPGRAALNAAPRTFAINNRTAGGLSDGDAQAIGRGFIRTQALIAWAELHKEIRFRAQLEGQPFVNSSSGIALAHGNAILNPPCALYPTAMAIHVLDPTSSAALGSFASSSKYIITARFDGPCTSRTQADDGTTQVLEDYPATITAAFGVTNLTDSVLGSLSRPESAVVCTAKPSLPGCIL
jgi:hypothetical protein